jgi:hypothetical protein
MRRSTSAVEIGDIIKEVVAVVVTRTSRAINEAISAAVQQQLHVQMKGSRPEKPVRRRRSLRRSRSARRELTRWVADRRARRVPTFVIEATGLAIKKQIVEKYGAIAVFEKGKPTPSSVEKAAAVLRVPASSATRKAKPPTIRKKAALSRG